MRQAGILAAVFVLSVGLWSHSPANAATAQLIVNGGFENGRSPWQESTANGLELITTQNPHSGSFSAWLCGYNNCNDQLWQTVTLPSSFSQLTLTYWVFIDTQEAAGSSCFDTFHSQVRTAAGSPILTAQSACNGNATNSWVSESFNLTSALTPFAGQQVQIYFQGTTDSGLPSDFFVDDVSLTASSSSLPTSTPTPGTPKPTSTPAPSPTPGPSATPTATSVPGTLTRISSDPFLAPTVGEHQSEVEPDTVAFGGTEVSAFQVGRIVDGGSTDIGWATFSGGAWHNGLLPGLTRSVAGGSFDRASDPSVAYDPAHGVWLVATLALANNSGGGASGVAIVVNRSTDGLSWSTPFTVSHAGSGDSYDKSWIACDTTPTSPFYGHCYAEWDLPSRGDLVVMSTSTDGGQHWSAPVSPAGSPSGLGGQPLVQPNGTVIVPASSGAVNAIIAFSSTNGGTSWSAPVTVASIADHGVAGGIRTEPLPSAEIDAGGKVYVVWQDCRFESGCAANDIVMSTSKDGVNWSAVTRIPIDPVGSGVDHFIPGLAVNRATSGSSAQLGLTYYFYPNASCSASTCQLEAGFVSSANGGASWSAPTKLAGPMSLSWLPPTSQGAMVGDYISTSFVNNKAIPVFAVAQAPNGSVLNQTMDSVQLTASGGTAAALTGPVEVARGGGSGPTIKGVRGANNREVTLH